MLNSGTVARSNSLIITRNSSCFLKHDNMHVFCVEKKSILNPIYQTDLIYELPPPTQ